MSLARITPADFARLKAEGTKIISLTTYDYGMTRLLDEIGLPLLLVGDSLGMVVLGYPDTTHVTMADMEHHVRACARAHPKSLLAADLPFGSCNSVVSAVQNSKKLIAAGACAVKAEGGRIILPQVEGIVKAGIPFIGHLGMLPQSVVKEGGYKIKGKTEAEKQNLIEEAKLLEAAGAFAIVLELVIPEVAKEISNSLRIPTIGIGSGKFCDGQILVFHDLVGIFPWFTPKFITPKVKCAELMKGAIIDWKNEFNQV